MNHHDSNHNRDGGFLFATFKGEGTPFTEQVYFALSSDGQHWEGLNGDEPVLLSALGEKGVRDPFLLRSHDGDRFYLIATDLSINLNPSWERAIRRGSHNIVVWESEDLVQWQKPRLVPVAPPDAGCTWAPEAVYDEASGEYLVFWASTTSRDNFAKHRIWAARTPDFHSFGEPFVYIEGDKSIIDTDIVREDDTCFRFSKDETHKTITMERSTSLLGTWEPIAGFTLANLKGYEGPQCFSLGERRWCLLLDHFSIGAGYQAFITGNLASGHFEATSNFSFPFRLRHGSVLPISAAERDRLRAAFSTSPNRQAEAPTLAIVSI